MSTVARGVLQVHRRSGNQFVQQLQRNLEAPDRVAHGKENQIVRISAGGGRVPFGQPCMEQAAAFVAGHGLVVGEIVGRAHEGVDGADRIPARPGQRYEGVVEILGFAPGDGTALGVGALQGLVVQ